MFSEHGMVTRVPLPEANASIDQMRVWFHQVWSENATWHGCVLAHGVGGQPLTPEEHRHHTDCKKHAERQAQAWFRAIGT